MAGRDEGGEGVRIAFELKMAAAGTSAGRGCGQGGVRGGGAKL